MNTNYHEYFDGCEIKPEFDKEFISLWPGWLGEESLHQMNEVTKEEWSRFNLLLHSLAEEYEIKITDCDVENISKVENIENTFSTYEESMNKDSSLFTQYVLPGLGCVISEDWDYTYIIWHKNNGAVEALSPFIAKAGLNHFHE